MAQVIKKILVMVQLLCYCISVAVLAWDNCSNCGVILKQTKNKQLYFSDGNNEIPTMEHVNPFR